MAITLRRQLNDDEKQSVLKKYGRRCFATGHLIPDGEVVHFDHIHAFTHTAEGRRAKAIVLLGCILGDDWRGHDDETDYPELMARRLLIEFVGGKPGEMLADQFA